MAAELPPVVCEESQLEQLVLNLATNARDAMPAGGHFRVSAKTEGQGVALVLADDGTGMSEDVKQHLFEPFFTTKPEGRGTGLGLSICYTTMQRLGGRIEVESAPGEGTRFTLWFPRAA